MPSGFVYDPSVVQGLVNGSAMRLMLLTKAERVASLANETAPIGSGTEHDIRVAEGADYKSNIGADLTEANGAPAGRAYAKATHSAYIEFGTWRMAPRATLRNALEGAART